MFFVKALLLCAVLHVMVRPAITGHVARTSKHKVLDIIHRILKVAGHGHGHYHNGSFVAFDVQLTRKFSARKNGDIVTYDKINVNVGNAYRHGEFVCPLDGVYEFVWITMCAPNNNCDHYLQLNSSRKRRVYGYERSGKHYLLTTASQILHLKKGDKVSIRLRSGHAIYSAGDFDSSFQGKLLYAD